MLQRLFRRRGFFPLCDVNVYAANRLIRHLSDGRDNGLLDARPDMVEIRSVLRNDRNIDMQPSFMVDVRDNAGRLAHAKPFREARLHAGDALLSQRLVVGNARKDILIRSVSVPCGAIHNRTLLGLTP
jgi:hypothetical protein